MRLFKCDHCAYPVYFDNTFCGHCGNTLGFDAQSLKMISLHAHQGGVFTGSMYGRGFHFCANHVHNVCNWVILDDDPAQYCISCALNSTVPDILKSDHLERWKIIEAAKRRLIYSLLRWKLPVISKKTDAEKGLAFAFKSNEGREKGNHVLTGHASGLITMNIAEADDVEREMAKNEMEEVYRTVLGHFRHEVGHYYWDLLIYGTEFLEPYRKLFGDETRSYQEALNKHYQTGAPKNWNEQCISPYATMHPWEDWAESWAHYLHMVDTLETAFSFGLTISPRISKPGDYLSTKQELNAYDTLDFDKIFNQWLPVTFMMNSMNRSMGAKDVYPFVINPPVKEKLRFIHNVIHGKEMIS